MFIRTSLSVLLVLATVAAADDPVYRYEANVLPYDPSAGWLPGGCDTWCTESSAV